jgi:hypothetical protein
MSIQIEKGVPVPPNSRHGGAGRYPFSEMQVGDSFFLAGGTAKRIGSAAYCYAEKHNPTAKFLVRTIKTEPAGARCWRIT